MFVQDADLTRLRQGDILQAIPFPLLSTGELVFLGKPEAYPQNSAVPDLTCLTKPHRNDPNWLTIQVPARLSFCTVLSQCCDLEPRHGKIRMPAFVVARLIPIPRAIIDDAQRFASLRANKDPRNAEDPGYINFFYIPQDDLLRGQEWVVDFNQTTSIPCSEFPDILTKKVLQMEEPWRVKFKIKLGASLTRLTQEERDAGLQNPWDAT